MLLICATNYFVMLYKRPFCHLIYFPAGFSRPSMASSGQHLESKWKLLSVSLHVIQVNINGGWWHTNTPPQMSLAWVKKLAHAIESLSQTYVCVCDWADRLWPSLSALCGNALCLIHSSPTWLRLMHLFVEEELFLKAHCQRLCGSVTSKGFLGGKLSSDIFLPCLVTAC